MSHEKAHQFIIRMRGDREFRANVINKPGPESLKTWLRESDLDFSMHDLVGAMAACMEEMERVNKN